MGLEDVVTQLSEHLDECGDGLASCVMGVSEESQLMTQLKLISGVMAAGAQKLGSQDTALQKVKMELA